MKITAIKAVPISFRVPDGQNVRLGIGRAVKRDAVLVKVTTPAVSARLTWVVNNVPA